MTRLQALDRRTSRKDKKHALKLLPSVLDDLDARLEDTAARLKDGDICAEDFAGWEDELDPDAGENP